MKPRTPYKPTADAERARIIANAHNQADSIIAKASGDADEKSAASAIFSARFSRASNVCATRSESINPRTSDSTEAGAEALKPKEAASDGDNSTQPSPTQPSLTQPSPDTDTLYAKYAPKRRRIRDTRAVGLNISRQLFRQPFRDDKLYLKPRRSRPPPMKPTK